MQEYIDGLNSYILDG